MFAELSLVHCLEMPWQALCLHGVHDWRAFLNLFRWVGFYKAEIFEVFRVGGLEVEVCGDVAAELEIVRVGVIVEQFLHSLQLFRLPLCKIVFVCRASIERQRVVRVLRVLLMEDIVLAVVPVGERGAVRAGLLNRSRRLNDLIHFPRGPLALLPAELSFVCCREVHPVRVNNLAFLLQIESLFVWLDFRLSQLAVVILAIVREECLGVRIFDESIGAAGHAGTLILVPSWQRIDYEQRKRRRISDE